MKSTESYFRHLSRVLGTQGDSQTEWQPNFYWAQCENDNKMLK